MSTHGAIPELFQTRRLKRSFAATPSQTTRWVPAPTFWLLTTEKTPLSRPAQKSSGSCDARIEASFQDLGLTYPPRCCRLATVPLRAEIRPLSLWFQSLRTFYNVEIARSPFNFTA